MTKVYFPDRTIKLLANLGLREDDALDVFYHGEYRKTEAGVETMVKKYAKFGYEIGVYYTIDKYNGEYVITYVWKRDRR